MLGLLFVVVLSLLHTPPSEASHPVFERHEVFLTCPSSGRVTNLDAVGGGSGAPSWGPDRPTGRFADGVGCAALDTPGYEAPPHSGRFGLGVQGVVVGNLDSIAVDLYAVQVAEEVLVGQLWVDLFVDGERLVRAPHATVRPLVEDVDDGIVRIRFAIGRLGVVEGAGAGSRAHDVHLAIWGNSVAPKAWAMGAGDVASGLVVNGDVVGLPVPELRWEAPPAQVEDPCGDTRTEVGGTPWAHPVPGGTDLREIGYTTTWYGDRDRTVSGVDVRLRTCEQFGDRGVADSARVTWEAAPAPMCSRVEGYVEIQSPPATREYQSPIIGWYGQDCVVGVGEDQTRTTRFRERLPLRAIDLQPFRVRVRLRHHDLSPAAAATLREGARLGAPSGFGSAFAGRDVEVQPPGVDAQVSLVDRTAPGPDLIVGAG